MAASWEGIIPLQGVSKNRWPPAPHLYGSTRLRLGSLPGFPVFSQPLPCTFNCPPLPVCSLELPRKASISRSNPLSLPHRFAFPRLWPVGSVCHCSAVFVGSFPQGHRWLSAQLFLLEAGSWKISQGVCPTSGIPWYLAELCLQWDCPHCPPAAWRGRCLQHWHTSAVRSPLHARFLV